MPSGEQWDNSSKQKTKSLRYIFKDRAISREKRACGMQPDTVALKLYEALAEGGDEELLFIIKQDYLFKPIRPKIWVEKKNHARGKKKVYRKYLEKYPELNLDLLYRYAHLEKSGNKYFLVTQAAGRIPS